MPLNVLWGCLIAAIGVFFLVSGTLESEFIIYKLLVARSERIWGERVHRFYQVAGVVVIVFGVLVALGVIR